MGKRRQNNCMFSVVTFALAFVVGCCLAACCFEQLWQIDNDSSNSFVVNNNYFITVNMEAEELKANSIKTDPRSTDKPFDTKLLSILQQPQKQHSTQSVHFKPSKPSIPSNSDPIKILCLVVDTGSDRHGRMMMAAKKTYLKHCNRIITMNRKTFAGSGGSSIPKTWRFMQDVWKELYSNRDKWDFDWLVKLNERNFFIPDNLRKYVVSNGLNASQSHVLGHVAIPKWWSQAPASLLPNAGYMMSKKAVSELGSIIDQCTGIFFPSSEEHGLAECLKIGGIRVGAALHFDAIDDFSPYEALQKPKNNGFLFLPITPLQLITESGTQSSLMQWKFLRWLLADSGENSYCCNDAVITFGNLDKYRAIYGLEFLLNHLRAFGATDVMGKL